MKAIVKLEKEDPLVAQNLSLREEVKALQKGRESDKSYIVKLEAQRSLDLNSVSRNPNFLCPETLFRYCPLQQRLPASKLNPSWICLQISSPLISLEIWKEFKVATQLMILPIKNVL